MKPEAIRGNQRQSVSCHTEAIRDHQMQSGRTSGAIRRNQTQSDAIRRNQTQSDAISMPGALLFSVFSCFGRAARACVLCFCVFVFWAGTTGLCVLLLFLAGTTAQRACVLCFRVLADPPLPPSKHSTGSIFYRTKHKQVIHTILAFIHAGAPLWPSL